MTRSQGNDAIGLFLVVLSGLVLVYGLPERLDLVPSDDDVYFDNGMRAVYEHQPLPVQMAPLFSGWYLFLNALTHNVINTQYLNWILLSVLPGLLFYGLLRSLRVGVVPSVALAVLYLFSPLNLPLDQKVSPFAMLWLMGGLLISNYQTDPVRKLTAAAAGALIATYVRPEFYLSFLLLSALPVALYVWKNRQNRAYLSAKYLPYSLLGLLLVAGLLAIVFGSPLSGGRSIIAFGQHFAMNYATWHPEIKLSPWMHSKVFLVKGFGREVDSIGEAFAANPSMFMRHISTNIVTLFTHTTHFVREMLITPWLSRLEFPGRRYLLLALAAAVIGLANWSRTWANLRAGFQRDGWYWLCLLILLGPTFISCILLLPRDHYVVFQMILYVSLAGTLLRAYTLRDLPTYAPAIGYVASLVALGLFLWPHWLISQQTKPTPIANLLRAMETIPVHKPVTMTGNLSLMYCLYLGPNWHFMHLGRYQPANLEAFARQNGINYWHIEPDLVKQYAKDPFFAAMIQNPAAAGYTKYSINVPDQYVLVQQAAVSIAHPPSAR